MSKFFERNKKKSALAALLLFLRERKVVSLLVFLVLGASILFVTPSSFIVGLPGGARVAAAVAWLASKAGVDISRWGLGRSGRFSDLAAAFRAAKDANANGRRAGWGAFFGGAGADSLGFVRGGKDGLGDPAVADKLAQQGGAVKGIVSPDDRNNRAQGVTIGEGEMRGGGYPPAAFAGGFGSAGALSGGAYKGAGMFSGGTSAGTKPQDDFKKVIDEASVGVARPSQTDIKGAKRGKSGKMDRKAQETVNAKGQENLLSGDPNESAFKQLAVGKGCAALSVGANCAPGSCPGEAAASATGAVYEGKENCGLADNVLLAAPVDGFTTPELPPVGDITGAINQANQAQADLKKCKDADAMYGATENSLAAQMTEVTRRLADDCGGSLSFWEWLVCLFDCSHERYCKRLGQTSKNLCNQFNNVRCAHTRACPLTASQSCSTGC